jgi:hypothetical protein
VLESAPPLISYASGSASHVGAVVETNAAWLKVHDPAVGEFSPKSFSGLASGKKDDILVIRPLAD